jgi:poly-gamma-glutamate biosynthesis protein PgsC/CapC
MTEHLPLSVGIGLAVAVLFAEAFGIGAGGLIVPGYLALELGRPLHVLATVLAGVATFFVVHAFGSVAIVYGRRRTALMILVGYLVGAAARWAAAGGGAGLSELDVIGFIIPGLIAIWIDRQGLVQTLAALTTASVLVRLLLVLVLGQELTP